MVDACHIVPFYKTYNNHPTNGIALCPNLHRAFDKGAIAVDAE
jgi:putative restriction endonuclease